ncbi:hypothetical protein KR054_008580, partial [Drosophila jambulina]
MRRQLRDFPRLICLLAALRPLNAKAQLYYTSPQAVALPSTKLPDTAPGLPRLLIYNPFNGQPLEPLRYSALWRSGRRPPVNGNIVELPQLWQPCSCAEFACRCCLGLVVSFSEAFNQRICAVVEYSPSDVGLRLSIQLNQRTVANLGFSARNPPDYCVPILLPLPLFSCLRLYAVRSFGEGNVQVCLSVVFKVLGNQFFEYRLNCVRFGANGVYFVRDDTLQTDTQQTKVELDQR